MLARFSRLFTVAAVATLAVTSCTRDLPMEPIRPDVIAADTGGPPPPNDNRDSATFVPFLPFNDSTDITNATVEPGEPSSSCDAFAGPASRSVWYFTSTHQRGLMTAQVFDSGGVVAVYAVSFDSAGPVLQEVACDAFGGPATFFADSGASFFFQVYDFQDLGAHLVFHLEQQAPPAPPNDDFANAQLAPGVPFFATADFSGATREPGEPGLCGFQSRTVWYAFTPAQTRVVVASMQSPFFNFIGVFTGTSLNDLSPVRCGNSFNPAPFTAVAGTTYFIQLSGDFDHTATFQLLPPPPPQANFAAVPPDPSIFDLVQFQDASFDPAGIGIQTRQWSFGDGATSSEVNPRHGYAADGDYLVQLTVMTFDGRTASTSRILPVRTRDVAITRFQTPNAGMTGRTSRITVDIQSNRNPETVQVDLFKSVPGGSQLVASSRQTLPVRNRVTSVLFSYTFTSQDAVIGKVTFRAVVTIVGGRDALPADNVAIGPPTNVNR